MSYADMIYITRIYTQNFYRETLIPCTGTYRIIDDILEIEICPSVPKIACLA
jgi:hypothetical protein